MSSLEMPFRVFQELSDGKFALESVETHSFPIELEQGQILEFKMIHSARRQDHTPRVYLSEKPRDLALSWGGKTNDFHLQRKPYTVRIIQSGNPSDRSQLYTYITQKNLVYLNIQNLENYPNGYKISNINYSSVKGQSEKVVF